MAKKQKRGSGTLLHISSLPGCYGVGDFGEPARGFADFLEAGGYSAWQVLPLSPVEANRGNSPYSCSSAFALNYLFVSPEKLAELGLIKASDYGLFCVEATGEADYEYARKVKKALFDIAWENFHSEPERFSRLCGEFGLFCAEEAAWLEDYALFFTLGESLGGLRWDQWPPEYRFREPAALSAFMRDEKNAGRMEYVRFAQFLLRRQWNELRSYCSARGIELIGDIPMYVTFDSADVWAGREFFDLGDAGGPNKTAGVPPDYFSADGQSWGNPVYRWDVMEETGFRWWVNRLKYSLSLFDRVRVDHFRGFCRYWAIPTGEKTAAGGSWEPAPGEKLFQTLRRELKCWEEDGTPLIAEDLGDITEDVHELMERFAIPGMKVLLFAFGGGSNNPYLPHNYGVNFVVYSGTHDNDTANGWWRHTSAEERRALEAYSGCAAEAGGAAKVISRLALSSVAATAIIPVQDILGLGGGARMNRPGADAGCWRWRLTGVQQGELLAKAPELRGINGLYGRLAGSAG